MNQERWVEAYDTNGKVAEEKEIKRQVNHTRLFWMQTEKPSQPMARIFADCICSG
jgi:hypothetical protein